MSFPVVGEIWTLFEATLNVQAKKLVEDIAKRQGADPKELWTRVKKTIKIAPVDSDLPDPIPVLCSFYTGHLDGCIHTRCRQPCLLGFDKCAHHVHKPEQKPPAENQVKRVYDFENKTYFVDEYGVAYDKSGTPLGTVEEDELKLFET